MVSSTVLQQTSARHSEDYFIDVHVGKRLMNVRVALGWSFMTLAEKLSISRRDFQAIERGEAHLRAEIKFRAALIKHFDVVYFIAGLEQHAWLDR